MSLNTHKLMKISVFRTYVLWELFYALASAKCNTDNISLVLTNLQDYNNHAFTASPLFTQVLSRISGLSLGVATESVPPADPDPAEPWGGPWFYDFFKELSGTWLKPAQNNLTRLTLACDELFGFAPKLDLRPLYFPKLKELELANFSISHKWQIDWIISHANTLTSLTLKDCVIVLGGTVFGKEDHEGYPMFPKVWEGRISKIQQSEFSWGEIFYRMEKELSNLLRFQFGGSLPEIGKKRLTREWIRYNEVLEHEAYFWYEPDVGVYPWARAIDTFNAPQNLPNRLAWLHAMAKVIIDDNTAFLRLSNSVKERRRTLQMRPEVSLAPFHKTTYDNHPKLPRKYRFFPPRAT